MLGIALVVVFSVQNTDPVPVRFLWMEGQFPLAIVILITIGAVTTIPAASNIGVAAAYGDWNEAGGAAAQLAINLTSIVLAGVIALYIQRRYYVARRRKHLEDPSRAAAGLPVGQSLHRQRR